METGRDRLRELLDAVLDEDNATLGDMAGDAFSSPFHLNRRVRRDAGEPPVSLRRRVVLERAAWQLRGGASVTDTAFAAGYESVEGFARAFGRAYGHPPSVAAARSEAGRSSWLPSPNGIHFHPPTSLWIDSQEHAVNPLAQQLVGHDLDDTRTLLEAAARLPDDDYRRARMPGHTVLEWDGPEESLAAVLDHLVRSKEVWLAALVGDDVPPARADDPPALLERHDAVAPRWLATWRDVDRRGAWDDRVVDALCEPPESFQLASVLAHVVTYAAHRRQLARTLLGADPAAGDPILWLRRGHDQEGPSA
ncbi:helix-turn-helix domain-containing protein [Nocardioides dongxiaopingii]|uniref:helix-turn-helix domain-containing protein n=1 Tax=Nocardioides sp. S-1144 TaxID=2582905 RepID=UPI00110D6E04|nr:helix-turn-helix domain-containing protein [Nocardioides sp. S-1144]QCW51539.1 helix-turn-helix domain-containing protein [Nocardioides sp. S-1144]